MDELPIIGACFTGCEWINACDHAKATAIIAVLRARLEAAEALLRDVRTGFEDIRDATGIANLYLGAINTALGVQCDGCQRGLPVNVYGNHRDEGGAFACTADGY